VGVITGKKREEKQIKRGCPWPKNRGMRKGGEEQEAAEIG